MKLRVQILSLGLLGLVATAIIGGIGLMNTAQLSTAFDASVGMGTALQKSQQADMMHDAIRSDVLLALLSAQTSDAKGLADAQEELKNHAQNFSQTLDALRQLPLDDHARAVVDKLGPQLSAYVQAASHVQQLAGQGSAAAQAAMPDFEHAFKALEQGMDEQSEAIHQEIEAYSAEVTHKVSSTKWQVGIGLLVAAVVLSGMAIGLSNSIVRPMSHAVHTAQRLAKGDLTSVVRLSGNQETLALLRAMQSVQASFGAIVQAVKSNAHDVEDSSVEIASGNGDLSSRTESQSSALQQAAASMEQLGSAVQQNASSASLANDLAVAASQVAVQGGEEVGKVVQTMKGIQDASQRISDIISVIEGIAFQTNILALNAAVEAARAGEQGRGFAVVASEVRSLAGRSSEAAKEIKTLIDTSVARVAQGNVLVEKAGVTMAEVVGAIKQVTDLMGTISTASAEQASGVTNVGSVVSQIERITQQNVTLVEQMSHAAGRLREQSTALVGSVAVFQLEG